MSPSSRPSSRADDETLLRQIRTVTNSRATYGYRRVWAVVNRTFRTGYNPKRQVSHRWFHWHPAIGTTNTFAPQACF